MGYISILGIWHWVKSSILGEKGLDGKWKALLPFVLTFSLILCCIFWSPLVLRMGVFNGYHIALEVPSCVPLKRKQELRKLITSNDGVISFVVTKKVIGNPAFELDIQIIEKYNNSATCIQLSWSLGAVFVPVQVDGDAKWRWESERFVQMSDSFEVKHSSCLIQICVWLYQDWMFGWSRPVHSPRKHKEPDAFIRCHCWYMVVSSFCLVRVLFWKFDCRRKPDF